MTLAAEGRRGGVGDGGEARWLRQGDKSRGKMITGEEKRKMSLRSGLMKSKIAKYLNSASVPKKRERSTK